MPRARAERTTEIQSDPIEPHKEIRAEAANDNDNIIELTDVVEEGKTDEKKERARAKMRAGIAAKPPKPVEPVSVEVMDTVRDALDTTKETAAVNRVRDVKTPPRPSPAVLKKSRAIQEKLDQEKIAKLQAHLKELPPEPTAFQKAKSVVDFGEAQEEKRARDRRASVAAKNKTIREGFAPAGDLKEKSSGIGLSEKEWFGQSEDMGKREKRKSAQVPRAEKIASRAKSAGARARQSEVQRSLVEEKKPNIFKKIGGFLGRMFGGGKELTLSDLTESVAREEGVTPNSLKEHKEQRNEVLMVDVLTAWNKSLTPEEKDWELPIEAIDSRNPVEMTIQDIQNRLGIRLLTKPGYNKSKKKLAIFSRDYLEGAVIIPFPKKSSPESRRKAA